jgi:hypothetical protein
MMTRCYVSGRPHPYPPTSYHTGKQADHGEVPISEVQYRSLACTCIVRYCCPVTLPTKLPQLRAFRARERIQRGLKLQHSGYPNRVANSIRPLFAHLAPCSITTLAPVQQLIPAAASRYPLCAPLVSCAPGRILPGTASYLPPLPRTCPRNDSDRVKAWHTCRRREGKAQATGWLSREAKRRREAWSISTPGGYQRAAATLHSMLLLGGAAKP